MAEACSFIKDLVPEVIIEKVTVETTGGTPALLTDNPHIDESATQIPIYAEDGETIIGYKSLAYGLIKADDITNTVMGYSRESGSVDLTQTVTVTVQFSIKEVISGGTTGTIASWFGQEDFTKYFSINCNLIAYNEDDKFSFVGPDGSAGEVTMLQFIEWTKTGAFILYHENDVGQMYEYLNVIRDAYLSQY